MGEAVPAGKAPAGLQAKKAAVQTGGKPVPSVAAASPGGTPVPREAEVRYKEALSAQRRGDFKGAEALYQRVLVLDPGHVRALNNLGVICLGQKKRERAIDLFSKAIVLKKDYVDPYYNLACLYAQTNEIDESLWYLKVAMTINGDVKNWVEKDADMKNVLASPAFKKIMEGQKN
jgi:tetratricopeptide (TPR) repeat protein